MSGPYFIGGCPNTACAVWEAFVNGGSGACGDISIAWSFLNGMTPGWNTAYGYQFDTPGSTSPDPADTSTGPAECNTPYGSSAGNITSSGWNLSGGEVLQKGAALVPFPQLYCAGFWLDSDLNQVPQATCILSGIPVECGNNATNYAYNLPLPSLDGCNATTNYAISYVLYNSAQWNSIFVPEWESTYPDLMDPGDCTPLPNDPFDDEDP